MKKFQRRFIELIPKTIGNQQLLGLLNMLNYVMRIPYEMGRSAHLDILVFLNYIILIISILCIIGNVFNMTIGIFFKIKNHDKKKR